MRTKPKQNLLIDFFFDFIVHIDRLWLRMLSPIIGSRLFFLSSNLDIWAVMKIFERIWKFKNESEMASQESVLGRICAWSMEIRRWFKLENVWFCNRFPCPCLFIFKLMNSHQTKGFENPVKKLLHELRRWRFVIH